MPRYVLQLLLSSVCWDGSCPSASEADIGSLVQRELWKRLNETRANPSGASRDELPTQQYRTLLNQTAPFAK